MTNPAVSEEMVERALAAQIEHMVNRFLQWKLPANFNPDAGISFAPEFNKEYNAKRGQPPQRHEPVGTNLFDADQAEAMVRHMLDGLPTKGEITDWHWIQPRLKEALEAKSSREIGKETGLGHSTICRLANGHEPLVSSYFAITKWLAPTTTPAAGPSAVAVKALTWTETLDRKHPEWKATTNIGLDFRVFEAWWGTMDRWAYVFDGAFYDTPDEAKAAAQADYEARILSCLSTLAPSAAAGDEAELLERTHESVKQLLASPSAEAAQPVADAEAHAEATRVFWEHPGGWKDSFAAALAAYKAALSQPQGELREAAYEECAKIAESFSNPNIADAIRRAALAGRAAG